jgi:hypothetical protein
VLDGVLHATELGDLPYLNGRPCSDYVKKAALKKMGRARWSRHVNNVIRFFAQAILPDYTVLGEGQAKLVSIRLLLNRIHLPACRADPRYF